VRIGYTTYLGGGPVSANGEKGLIGRSERKQSPLRVVKQLRTGGDHEEKKKWVGFLILYNRHRM